MDCERDPIVVALEGSLVFALTKLPKVVADFLLISKVGVVVGQRGLDGGLEGACERQPPIEVLVLQIVVELLVHRVA